MGKSKSIRKIGAFDLGASGGKFIIGIFERNKFSIKEIHRFNNNPTTLYLKSKLNKKPVQKIYWNDIVLYDEIINGLKKLSNFGIKHLDSLGITTWGADGGFVNKQGEIIGRIHNYRDHRLDNIRDEIFKLISEKKLFQLTGVVSQPFNEINQLFWMAKYRPGMMKTANSFLPIPTIFYYHLSGARFCEYTWASTMQLLDKDKKSFSKTVFEKLKIPISIMPPLVNPGTKVGFFYKELAKEIGINRFEVIATATHDTASAYVGAPIEREESSLIISSGTWSLVGKLIPSPIVNEDARRNLFTNEGGVGNIRFLKNVMGTWILQELRRLWKEKDKRELSWDKMVKLAGEGKRFYALIDPDDRGFYNPENMEKAIKNFCKETGQKVPGDRGTILRMVCESLAIKYQLTNELIENITGKKNNFVYIVGGGAKNFLLNQFTADATGLPVVAGPVEATAIGNIMVQAKTLGIISSLKESRKLIKNSFPLTYYQPETTLSWKKTIKIFKEKIWQN